MAAQTPMTELRRSWPTGDVLTGRVGDGAVQVCRVKAGVGKDAAGERVVDDVHRVRRIAVAGDAKHGRAPDEQRGLETDCQECQGDRPDLEGCTDPIA